MAERMVPQNVEAEEAVLGSILIDPEALFRVMSFLGARDFYVEKNGWIYEAVLSLREQRRAVDYVTLCDELERREQLAAVGGAAYISQLVNAVPSAIHAESYGHIVEHAAIRRRMIQAASEVAQLAYQEDLAIDEAADKAERAIFAVTQRRASVGLVSIRDGVDEYYARLEERYRNQDAALGVPTGYVDVDRILGGGLQRSDFVVVAARPSVGKSSLCFGFAKNAARYGQRVAIFSLEMAAGQIIQRMLASESGVAGERLQTGRLRDEDWPPLTSASGKVAGYPIFIDDTPMLSALQVRAKARRMHAEHGLDMIVVDYLQLMGAGNVRTETRNQEVSYISRSLKALARELDVPVVCASQLSRSVERRNNKRPLLSDLRDSGAIEQDADVVMFIYRDEMYNPETEDRHIAEIIVAKHRNGPTGVARLFFRERFAEFLNAETKQLNL